MATNIAYIGISRHPEDLRQLIRSSLRNYNWNILEAQYEDSDEHIAEVLRSSEAVLFAPARYLSDHVLKNGMECKLFQIWSSGYDKFNINAANKYQIPVANNGGGNSVAVYEHTILLMLAVYKNLVNAHRMTVSGDWSGNSHGMDQFILKGKKLGIIGLGNIGTGVAKLAVAFGMEVSFYDINPNIHLNQSGFQKKSFDQILANSDIVSLHIHLNTETRDLIGEKELSMMKNNSVIINVSRGELINKEALIEALDSGKLLGAGFDAYHEEPTRPNDPLLKHPRVVATPHMACTYDTHVSALKVCTDNISRVLEGNKPKHIVC